MGFTYCIISLDVSELRLSGRRIHMSTHEPSELAKKKCVPCAGGVPHLKGKELHELLSKLNSSWKIIEDRKLEKEYEFSDFRHALSFTNKIGEVAEHEGHHPDIYLAWGKVKVMIWTHKINGLTESDFILAAKCDEVYTSSSIIKACF